MVSQLGVIWAVLWRGFSKNSRHPRIRFAWCINNKLFQGAMNSISMRLHEFYWLQASKFCDLQQSLGSAKLWYAWHFRKNARWWLQREFGRPCRGLSTWKGASPPNVYSTWINFFRDSRADMIFELLGACFLRISWNPCVRLVRNQFYKIFQGARNSISIRFNEFYWF